MKKFFIPFMVGAVLAGTACSNDDKDNSVPSVDRSIAEKQLMVDYAQYNLSDIKWRNSNGYEVAQFSATTKSSPFIMEAWYQTEKGKANRVLDNKDFGKTIPEIIQAAFAETIYSNATLWKVDDVDLETRFTGSTLEVVYIVELESLTNKDLEAKLIFDTEGHLIFSREYQDTDDKNDKYIVSDRLIEAVHVLYPDAKIVDAEYDDNKIEVDAIIVDEHHNIIEIELVFDKNYQLISQKCEHEYTFETLPIEFKDALNDWYLHNTDKPHPTNFTRIEVEEKVGKFMGKDFAFKVEFELGDFEFTFYMDDHYVIVGEDVEFDD